MNEDQMRAVQAIDDYFKSGNSVPVSRATIKREEWEQAKAALASQAKSVPEIFVLTATNYWKNKKGSMRILGVSCSVEDAKNKIRNSSFNKVDFDKAEWNLDETRLNKLVDYDGAAVRYEIIRYAAPQPTDDRVQELEKDAARYRWLKDNYHGFAHYRSGVIPCVDLGQDIDRQIVSMKEAKQ